MSFINVFGMDPLSFALTAYAAASVALSLYTETLPGLDVHEERYLHISELTALMRSSRNIMDRQRLIRGGRREVTSIDLHEVERLESDITRLSIALGQHIARPHFYIIRQPLDVIQRLQALMSPEKLEIWHLFSEANQWYYFEHCAKRQLCKGVGDELDIQFPIPQVATQQLDIEAGYSADQLRMHRSYINYALRLFLKPVWQSEKNFLAQCQIQFPIPHHFITLQKDVEAGFLEEIS